MSQEARYFRVGLFVLAGAALIVGAVLVLGGRGLLEEPVLFETVFDESVQGLEVGSPVKLRGVKIGQVAEIGLAGEHYPFASEEERLRFGQYVLVRFEALPEDLPERVDEEARRRNLEALIQRGLRLRLTAQGITGTSFVEADFVEPEKNPPLEIPWQPQHLYIPSTPSTLTKISTAAERLFGRLEDLDVEKVIGDLDGLLVSLDDAVEAFDVPALKQEGQALLAELRGAVGQLRTDLRQSDLPGVGASAREALDEANTTLVRLRQAVDGGSYDLELALENLRVASEDLRDLTQTLRSQPSLLIRSGPPEDEGGGEAR